MDTEIEHKMMVGVICKDGDEIKAELTGDEAHLWHMATGVAGEGGELLDAIKKHVVYRQELDVENVIEELGDLEFYMEGIRQELGISRVETLRHNLTKLAKRYENFKYSNQRAQDRADKQNG